MDIYEKAEINYENANVHQETWKFFKHSLKQQQQQPRNLPKIGTVRGEISVKHQDKYVIYINTYIRYKSS